MVSAGGEEEKDEGKEGGKGPRLSARGEAFPPLRMKAISLGRLTPEISSDGLELLYVGGSSYLSGDRVQGGGSEGS